MVESSSDEILASAQSEDIAFLVVGDPFGYVRYKAGRDGEEEQEPWALTSLEIPGLQSIHRLPQPG
jgi:diphthine synthase